MIDLNSLIIALVTALLTSILYWRQVKADLQKEYESKFNSRRWEVYLKFIESVRIVYYQEKTVDGDYAELNENEIMSLACQILLIGSKNVVEAFGVWRKIAREHSEYDDFTKEKLGELINQMRKDLGNRNSRLEYKMMRGVFPQ